MNKQDEYSQKIYFHLLQIFEQDSDNYINQNELAEGDNATHFFHALATMAPNILYNQLSGDQQDNLGFNHIANRMTFQFSKKDTDE